MKQTQTFTKTRKEIPSDEQSKNAQLLIRAGYVHKEMAGVYAYLPLGLKVLENIKQVVREEMDAIGGQELIMTTLQNKQLWEQSGRWDDDVVDVWFKTELKNGGDVGLGWSHEEPIGTMMKNYLGSYKDLPVSVYQFQTKFRNELRAKSGIMRGREFLMKDAYSFAAGEDDHEAIYEAMKTAYKKIFSRLGLADDTYITHASGGAFTEFSHEFQTICDAGEDVCYIDRKNGLAVNEEVFNDETIASLGAKKEDFEKITTAEVGNIFNFGRKKADDIGLMFKSETGEEMAVWMGSYGIGITRLMGVLAEKFADDKGLVWPEAVAPFKMHLVALNLDDTEVRDYAEGQYNTLCTANIDVLYDDRVDARAGEKFADSDLLGIPYRVIISRKTKEEGVYEVVKRKTGEVKYMNEKELQECFTGDISW